MSWVDHIELHDSALQARVDRQELILELVPAYVHHWERRAGAWSGVGRVQRASIRIADSRISSALPTQPTRIAGGWFQLDGSRYENLVPAPLNGPGEVQGFLSLASGETLTFAGRGLVVELGGPARDIEPLPLEWAPADGGA